MAGRPKTAVTDEQKDIIALGLARDNSFKQISRDCGLTYEVTKRVARESNVVSLALLYRQEINRQLIQKLGAEIGRLGGLLLGSQFAGKSDE